MLWGEDEEIDRVAYWHERNNKKLELGEQIRRNLLGGEHYLQMHLTSSETSSRDIQVASSHMASFPGKGRRKGSTDETLLHLGQWAYNEMEMFEIYSNLEILNSISRRMQCTLERDGTDGKSTDSRDLQLVF